MDRLIRLEPSNTVAIRVEPGQRCSGELTLHNVMYTMPVAFRLQPVDRTRYDIRPQSGIIPPLATLTVEITYIYQHGTTTITESDDSFLLHSVVVPGASSSSSSPSPLPNDWFTTRKKQVFVDSGIRISFVGSVVLVKLVAEGAMEKLRDALERSEPEWRPADAVDSHGQTLLHLAIARKRADLVQLLLEFDPNVEAPDLQGRTPLEAAAAAGDALVVELLLARRASTERQENKNNSNSHWGPLHHAAARGHSEVMRLLLLKGAAVDAQAGDGRTALHLAAGERGWECARLLLAAGAKSDSCGGAEGDTPLHVAAASGDEGMVRLLLSRGVAGLKDIRSRAGRTAYDKAAEAGHTRLFDALRLGDGLCMAARKGEAKAAGRLVERGATVNGRDQYGWTALMRAGFKGRTEMMRALLEKGAEVDARDEEGYTALHCAAEAGQTEAVEVLVKRGADVDARTAKGATAMQIAGSLGYSGVARILAQGGASRDGAPPVEGGGGVAPAAVAAERLVAASGFKSKVAERGARIGRSRLGSGGAATVGGRGVRIDEFERTAMAVH